MAVRDQHPRGGGRAATCARRGPHPDGGRPYLPAKYELFKEGREAYERSGKDARSRARRECFECIFRPEPKEGQEGA